MGSIIEQSKDIRGSSKTSINTNDVNDTSQELNIHLNDPVICKCDSVVRQALNVHFTGGAWHFTASDNDRQTEQSQPCPLCI